MVNDAEDFFFRSFRMTTTAVESTITTDHITYKTDPWDVILSFLILEILATCVILFINTFVLILVLKCRKKQHYVVSLIAANLSAGILVLPFTIFAHVTRTHSSLPCQLFHYFIHVAECAEVYSLVAIAVDRYLVVINRQVNGSSKSKVPSRFGVAIIWFVSIIYSIASPFLHELHVIVIADGDAMYRSSECISIDSPVLHKTFVIMDAIVLFVAPLVIISAAYTGLVFFIRKESRNRSIASSRRKVVRTVLLLVGIFVVFNLPLLILDIYLAFGPGHFAYEGIVQRALELAAMLNFCVNPFVYALMSSSIRLRGCLQNRTSENASNSSQEMSTSGPSRRMARMLSGTNSTVAPISATSPPGPSKF